MATRRTIRLLKGRETAEAFAYGHGAIQMLLAEEFTFQDVDAYEALADDIGR